MDTVKEYTNGEVIIVWKAHLCTHSTNCFKGLPKVFQPKNRPWIQANGNTTPEIIAQVSKCPSGALTHYLNQNNTIHGESRTYNQRGKKTV